MARTLTVALGARTYPISIGEGTLDGLTACLAQLQGRGAVGLITDSHVAPLYGARTEELIRATGRTCVTHVLPAGEEHKRLSRIEEICGSFLDAGLDRASLIVALGGGVVGDIAGFAASVFMRGIPFIQIPTTIVAQVDSSVGGKTGVNHPLGKNTIGAFHQPSAVLIDMTLLRSLPGREIRAGIAEIIKHGVIADEELFAYMERHAETLLAKDLAAFEYPILRSCEIKSAVVAEDEREHGKRANLNYGHTFGHAIEAVTQYTKYLHGEAVALGMCAAANLGHDLGLVDDAFVARQRACCAAYGLPVSWPELPVDAVAAAMKKDKKARAGTLKFIVPTSIGTVVHRTDITETQAKTALAALRAEAWSENTSR